MKRSDVDATRAAQQVQWYAPPTWCVLWSPRFRRFEAWECSDPDRCRIVHAKTASELWDQMQNVDLDLWRTRPGADQPLTPRMAGRLGLPLPVAPGPGHSPRGGQVPEPRLSPERSPACSRLPAPR